MKLFVMPTKAGIHAKHFLRKITWIPAFAGMTALLCISACAYKGSLKSPSQIEAAEAKKAEKEKKKGASKPQPPSPNP